MSMNQPPLPVIKSPLDAGHLNQIRAALSVIDQLGPEIIKAKQAGIDVSMLEQQMNDSKQKLLGVKNVYFPGQ